MLTPSQVMLVPQCLAYSALAGLPLTTGFNNAFLPVLIYACLGTCPQMSVVGTQFSPA